MTALSPARAARLAELRARLMAVHLERCEQLRAAVQDAVGAAWQVDSWPVRRYGATGRADPLHVDGYRVMASERHRQHPRHPHTFVDVAVWAPEAPNWQADAYRRMLGIRTPDPNLKGTT